jgi:hypothetical protein
MQSSKARTGYSVIASLQDYSAQVAAIMHFSQPILAHGGKDRRGEIGVRARR